MSISAVQKVSKTFSMDSEMWKYTLIENSSLSALQRLMVSFNFTGLLSFLKMVLSQSGRSC